MKDYNRLSKVRLAAMSIAAKSCKNIIDAIPGLDDLRAYVPVEGRVENTADILLGKEIWNELSTMGLRETSKIKLAKCFELSTGVPVIQKAEISSTVVSIGSFIYSRRAFGYASVVPTTNPNSHSYPIGTVCVLNSTASHSSALRIRNWTGNQLPRTGIALPTIDKMIEFFGSNGGDGTKLNELRQFYPESVLNKAFDHIDECIEDIEKYNTAVNELIEINRKFNRVVVPVV